MYYPGYISLGISIHQVVKYANYVPIIIELEILLN
jgi:hypothetical protein